MKRQISNCFSEFEESRQSKISRTCCNIILKRRNTEDDVQINKKRHIEENIDIVENTIPMALNHSLSYKEQQDRIALLSRSLLYLNDKYTQMKETMNKSFQDGYELGQLNMKNRLLDELPSEITKIQKESLQMVRDYYEDIIKNTFNIGDIQNIEYIS